MFDLHPDSIKLLRSAGTDLSKRRLEKLLRRVGSVASYIENKINKSQFNPKIYEGRIITDVIRALQDYLRLFPNPGRKEREMLAKLAVNDTVTRLVGERQDWEASKTSSIYHFTFMVP